MSSADYLTYINSGAWDERRRWAYRRARYECELCTSGSVELHAHHVTYERLGSEWQSDLVVLCGRCHRAVHSGDEDAVRRVERIAERTKAPITNGKLVPIESFFFDALHAIVAEW